MIQFQNTWNKAKNSIFRLESLPEYRIKHDLENFEKFKKRNPYIGSKERQWFSQLKKTKQKGVKIQRTRIISLPLSDYLRYEINFWQHSIKNGEEILFLDKKDYIRIKSKLKIKSKDFWMFDDKVLVIFYYDSKGRWLNEKIITNNKVINNYKKLKKELIKHAVPMYDFLKRY